MRALRLAPLVPLAIITAACASAAEDAIADQAFAIEVDGAAGTPPRKAVLSFDHDHPHLTWAGDPAQPLTYRALRGADGSTTFEGTVAGGPIHGTVVGEEVKGELGAGAGLRLYRGARQVEAASLLERARELQLERRPREAIDVYERLIENHRMELDWSAPALVYLVECFQLLRGDAKAEQRYRQLAKRYLSQPPPLDGSSRLTLEHAREDLQLMPWGNERRPVPQASNPQADPMEAVMKRLEAQQTELEKVQRAQLAAAWPQARTDGRPFGDLPSGWFWWLEGDGQIASPNRFDGALIRRRHDDLFDGTAKAMVGHVGGGDTIHAEILEVSGGTDATAVDSGTGIGQVSFVEVWRPKGSIFFGGFGLDAGRSAERGGIREGELLLSILHFDAARDDAGWTYRVGVQIPDVGLRDLCGNAFPTIQIGLHRIIDEKLDSSHLATETSLLLTWQTSIGIGVSLGGSYCHGAFHEDGSRDNVWSGQIGLSYRLLHAF